MHYFRPQSQSTNKFSIYHNIVINIFYIIYILMYSLYNSFGYNPLNYDRSKIMKVVEKFQNNILEAFGK